MNQVVARIVEAAKGNEEVEALLATIGEGTPDAEACDVLAQAAAKLGIEIDPNELSDENLADIAGGIVSTSAIRHLAREREYRQRMGEVI